MASFNHDPVVSHLARMYESSDVVRQRQAILEASRLQPGQQVVDVGAGPGLLAVEAARLVANGGRVVAIDASDRMLAATDSLAAEAQVDVETVRADAVDLPLPDDSFDVVLSTQVLEYVQDVEKALAEMARVLKPGGRVCILDTDWRSCIWETSDRQSTDQLLHAWRDHFVHPDLPRRLRTLLIGAGFEVESVDAVPIVNTAMAPDAYSTGMARVICRFLRGHAAVDTDAVDRFEADLRELDEQGRYFFSLSRFLATAVAR
jgi:ubiquinone/menaquinone biosynthesis C-methylase UbiE